MDGTIIDAMSGSVLRPLVRETFTAVHKLGEAVVLWSAGGAEYARRKANERGVDQLVTDYFSKTTRTDDGRFDASAITAVYDVVCFVDDLPTDAPSSHELIRVNPYLGSSPHDSGLAVVLRRVARASA